MDRTDSHKVRELRSKAPPARTTLEFRNRPTVLRFIGDSHSLIFDNSLFEFGNAHNKFLYIKSAHMIACHAGQFMDHGCLNPIIVDWLFAEGLLPRTCLLGVRQSLHTKRQSPIAISCGDEDLFGEFLRSPVSLENLGTDAMRRRVWSIFEPLHRGIELLKSATTNPIFLLGIPPPTGNDQVSARCRGYLTKARTRIGAARLFNDVNQDLSRNSGAIFIDLWGRLAGACGLKPEYTFDGVHLNGKAALIVLSELAANLSKVRLAN